VSHYQTSSASEAKAEVVDASKLVRYVTVIGRLAPISSEDHMKLARLAHDFRRAVLVATRMVAKGRGTSRRSNCSQMFGTVGS
jgi:cell division inhibitor SulA